jgi:hypothetical protein
MPTLRHVFVTAVVILFMAALLLATMHRNSREFSLSITSSSTAMKTMWNKSTVLVVSAFDEWDSGVPHYASNDPALPWETFLYQRRDPVQPRFVPNFGYEASVYLAFVVEHYDDLPNISVFIQADVPPDGPWSSWTRCVKPDTSFAQLPVVDDRPGTGCHSFYTIRSIDFFDGMMSTNYLFMYAECMRDILTAFGISVPPRHNFLVHFHACGGFLASRDQLRRHPREVYEAALKLVVEPVCHNGSVNFDTSYIFHKYCPNGPASCPDLVKQLNEHAGRREDAPLNKVGAVAFEHLWHMVIGGSDFVYPSEEELPCNKFLPASGCPGSPCNG